MQYAAKTNFEFPILGSKSDLDLSTGGATAETSKEMRHTLDDLAQLQYLPARLKVQAFDIDGSAAGTMEVELMAGTTSVATVTVEVPTGGEAFASTDVDLFNVGGAQELYLKATTTSAGSGTTSVGGRLEVRQPLVIGTC